MHELGNDILDQVIYRGEGNSNIVIALKARAKVIRLLKRNEKTLRSSQAPNHLHVAQHPLRSIRFIHLIMKPLTDPFSSGATELIHLKSDFVNQISKRVEAHRPLHRLDKTLLLDDQYALIMDDLCTLPNQLTRQLLPVDLCGPTISVEIKPKQGFLPMHRLIMKSSINEQLGVNVENCCLYGSHQYLKMARGRISRTSSYCPINLFSGCPMRMKNELEELLKNPQNNLRIFKDLSLVYGESNQIKQNNVFDDFFEDGDVTAVVHHNNRPHKQVNDESRLVELLIQCLLKNHNTSSNTADERELTGPNADNENSSFNSGDNCLRHLPKTKCRRCDTYPSSKKHKPIYTNSPHRLPQSCVLSIVLRAQKLDSIGAQDALGMLEWLLEDAKTNDKNLNVLEELSRPQVPKGFGSLHQLANETKQQYYFRKVWEFLVSLTAKDCSIIVTIRRIAQGRYESIMKSRPGIRNHLLKDHSSDTYYLFNVGIADLDQKLPFNILKMCDNLNLVLQSDYFKRDNLSSHRQSNQQVLA